MLSANEPAPLQEALDDALALGATSGSDLVAGLLSGVYAWVHPPSPAEVPRDY
jgi:hypothetical protein